jgi:hypothetical protein
VFSKRFAAVLFAVVTFQFFMVSFSSVAGVIAGFLPAM